MKPQNKREAGVYTELREFRFAIHTRAIKKYFKKMASRARRATDKTVVKTEKEEARD